MNLKNVQTKTAANTPPSVSLTVPQRLSIFIELGVRLQRRGCGAAWFLRLVRVDVLVATEDVLQVLILPGYVYRIQRPKKMEGIRFGEFKEELK